jgi:hypothetical protein
MTYILIGIGIFCAAYVLARINTPEARKEK